MYWKTHYFAKTYPENYEKTIGADIDGVDDDDDYEGDDDDDDDDQHNDDGCGDEDDVDQDNDDAMMVLTVVKVVRLKMTTKRRR